MSSMIAVESRETARDPVIETAYERVRARLDAIHSRRSPSIGDILLEARSLAPESGHSLLKFSPDDIRVWARKQGVISVLKPEGTPQSHLPEAIVAAQKKFQQSVGRPPTLEELRDSVVDLLDQPFKKSTVENTRRHILKGELSAETQFHDPLELSISIPTPSGVFDDDWKKAYRSLHEKSGVSPTAEHLQAQLVSSCEITFSVDHICRHSKKIGLDLSASKTAFCRALIKKHFPDFKENSGEKPTLNRFRSFLREGGVFLEKDFDVHREDLANAMVSLRRYGSASDRKKWRFARGRIKNAPLGQKSQVVKTNYEALCEALGKAPSMEQLCNRLKRSAGSLFVNVKERHFRDGVQKMLGRLERRLERPFPLSPSEAPALTPQDAFLHKAFKSYLRKYAERPSPGDFCKFLKSDHQKDFSQRQVQHALSRVRNRALGDQEKGFFQFRSQTAALVETRKIIRAYANVKVNLEIAQVKRAPSIRELMTELRQLYPGIELPRGRILRERMKVINYLRTEDGEEPLKLGKHSHVQARIVFGIYKNLKQELKRNPTLDELHSAVDAELPESYSADSLQGYIYRINKNPKKLLGNEKAAIVLDTPGRSGLHDYYLLEAVEKYKQEHNIAPLLDDIHAALASQYEVRISREYLAERLQDQGHDFFFKRSQQVEVAVKQQFDSWKKSAQRQPTVEEILERLSAKQLSVSRDEALAAARALRSKSEVQEQKANYQYLNRSLSVELFHIYAHFRREHPGQYPDKLEIAERSELLTKDDIDLALRELNQSQKARGKNQILLRGTSKANALIAVGKLSEKLIQFRKDQEPFVLEDLAAEIRINLRVANSLCREFALPPLPTKGRVTSDNVVPLNLLCKRYRLALLLLSEEKPEIDEHDYSLVQQCEQKWREEFRMKYPGRYKNVFTGALALLTAAEQQGWLDKGKAKTIRDQVEAAKTMKQALKRLYRPMNTILKQAGV